MFAAGVRFLQARARDVRAADKTRWDGYSGVFLDPDGHRWEVAYGPGWKIADDGSMSMA